ncbi:MAG: response regulator transcription factor [Clostridiaceae bacterium]|nr:response regulator transcription factor [Clostridiaceae bacterium]
MRILLVEDEIYLSEALCQILKKNNYTVDAVFDGETGLDYAKSNIYDIIILDIMLPVIDGITVLRALRKEKINAPVLMLTAKGEVQDIITGLDMGADDYLTKPFDTGELLARLRALARRRGERLSNDESISFGDITLNTLNLTLFSGGKEVRLTLKESELLEYLILHKNGVATKDGIIEKLWGFDSGAEANHVEVYISFLRKKLNYLKSKTQIETIRGVGYILREEG